MVDKHTFLLYGFDIMIKTPKEKTPLTSREKLSKLLDHYKTKAAVFRALNIEYRAGFRYFTGEVKIRGPLAKLIDLLYLRTL